MKPERVQLKRVAGWRMPPSTIKVDRTTPWGNWYRVGVDGTAAECVAKYRADVVAAMAQFRVARWKHKDCQGARFVAAHLRDIRGLNLACWCRPGDPCHGEVLLELANLDAR